MATGTSLITAAAKRLNIIDAGESLSSDELADGLVVLNELVGNFNSQELLATAATADTIAVVAATQTATLGTAYRKVIGGSHIISSGFTVPVQMVDAVTWNTIPDRDIQGNMIRFAFYNRGATSGIVYFSPRPIANGTFTYIAWAAQATWASLATDNTLLPGYEQLIVTQLALNLAPLFSRKPDDALVASAHDAMAEIKLLNSSLMGDMSATPAASAAPVSA